MFRLNTVRCNVAVGAQSLAEELAKILPALSRQSQSAPDMTFLSSIAVTSARRAVLRATGAHSPDCPVQARQLPLGLIASEPSFLKRPCDVCLAKRTHFLACELFSREFESRCRSTAKTPVPADLERTAISNFGDVKGMRRMILNFSTSSLSFGRIWLVCRSDGSLAVVTLSETEIPQTLGLWPLAVVNVGESSLCHHVESRAEPDTCTQQPAALPSWSRAVRNPGSTLASLGCGANEGRNLGDLRRAVAEAALDAMNWSFVDKQLAHAITYFQSEERLAKKRAVRSRQERDAAHTALKQMKAAQNVSFDDSDDFEVEAVMKSTERDNNATTVTMDQPEKALVDADVTPDVPEETPVVAPTKEVPPQDDVDPVTAQLPDGTWEYRYKNGDITRLHVDGKKVFKTQGLTTTVFPNADTLFEYENKTTILDRADGVRVTTFPDGRKTEERIK